MVLAVLGNRAGLKLSDLEVYVATVGGVKIAEPVADLAVAIAVASSVMDKPIHPGLVAIGEVGLAGEVRRVGGLEKRLAEAARLGFTKAIVPADTPNRGKELKPMDMQAKYGLKVFSAARHPQRPARRRPQRLRRLSHARSAAARPGSRRSEIRQPQPSRSLPSGNSRLPPPSSTGCTTTW